MNPLLAAAKQLVCDAGRVSLDLFKVMVPVIVATKILQELDWIRFLAAPLEPAMELVGLPARMGLVWATAIFSNLYSGMVVYVALVPEGPALTTAQVTVLCTMMLIAHGLPVELQVAHKCGPSRTSQALVRLLGALGCGLALSWTFSALGLLQEPSRPLWSPEPVDPTLPAWAWSQTVTLASIFSIILGMMALMQALHKLRVTELMNWLLAPALRLLGVGRSAAAITVVGLTMGVTYGAGLILHEIRTGKVERKDVFASVTLMGLSHALIEDTLLMSLLGASTLGTFWGRLLFSLIVVALLTRIRARRLGRAAFPSVPRTP